MVLLHFILSGRYCTMLNCRHHLNHITQGHVKWLRLHEFHSTWFRLVSDLWDWPVIRNNLLMLVFRFGYTRRCIWFLDYFFPACTMFFFWLRWYWGSFVSDWKSLSSFTLCRIVVKVWPNIFHHHLQTHLKQFFYRLLIFTLSGNIALFRASDCRWGATHRIWTLL